MPAKTEIKQIWKCSVCGNIQRCPIPATEVICSHKHPHKKMDLIEGEPFKEKVKNGKK